MADFTKLINALIRLAQVSDKLIPLMLAFSTLAALLIIASLVKNI